MRTDIDIEFFRDRLLRRLEEISASRKTIKPVELDQARVGRLSRMDALQQQEIALAANRLTIHEEQRIRAALDRISRGEFGYCALCDEEIAEGRLQIDPSVAVCIDCARAQEKR